MDIHPDAVPLRVDEAGAVRVGNTQVLFALVVQAFESGADPESIIRMFTSLELADVYMVIGYYLRHRQEVTEWLVQRERAAAELRSKIEAAQGPSSVTREVLQARWAALEKQRAATGK